MRPIDADEFDRVAKAQHEMWVPMMETDEKYRMIDVGFMLAAGVVKGMPPTTTVDDIVALRAERAALRAENEAFKADIEAGRLVRPCKCGSLPRERETAFGPSGSGYEVYCPRCKVRIENFAACMDGAKRNARCRWNSAALSTDARMDGKERG